MERSIRGFARVGSAALVALVGSILATAGATAAEPKAPRDPNEKICQVITPVGSRLATKKICATRAEWEDKKRQDREATEKAQTQLCVVNPVTGKC
jgi:hypothetical protein